MSSILVIDASANFCSVALHHQNQSFFRCEDQPRRHAQRLLPLIHDVLQEGHLIPEQLHGIAYGRGPGSFTGLRIAAATLQGLSLAHDIPIFGMSSLQATATDVVNQYRKNKHAKNSHIFAIMNAHMGEVFWGGFSFEEGQVTCVATEKVGTASQCFQDWEEFSHCYTDAVIAGDGLKLTEVQNVFENISPVDGVATDETNSSAVACFPEAAPVAENMLPFCQQAFNDNQFGVFEDFEPRYLRDSVAWKKLSEQPKLLNPTQKSK